MDTARGFGIVRIAILKLHIAVPAEVLLVVATPFAMHVVLRRLNALRPLGLEPRPTRDQTLSEPIRAR